MFYFNASDTGAIDPETIVGMTEECARRMFAAFGIRVFEYESQVHKQVIRDAIGWMGVDGPVRVPYRLAAAAVSHGKVRDVRVSDRTAEAVPCLLVACDSTIHDATSFEMWDLTPVHDCIDRLEFEC